MYLILASLLMGYVGLVLSTPFRSELYSYLFMTVGVLSPLLFKVDKYIKQKNNDSN